MKYEVLDKIQQLESLIIIRSFIDQISDFKFNNLKKLKILDCGVNDFQEFQDKI